MVIPGRVLRTRPGMTNNVLPGGSEVKDKGERRAIVE